MEDEPQQNTNNSLVTIFTIWNTMIGTSILAMPWGMEQAGLFCGFILCFLMGSICAYTAYCNVTTYKEKGNPGDAGELFALTRDILGPCAEYIAKIFSVMVLAGVAIIFWILLSNFFYFNVYFIFYSIKGDEKIYLEWSNTVLCPLGENSTAGEAAHESDTFKSIWKLRGTVPFFLILILFPLLNFRSPTFFTKFTSLGTLSVIYVLLFAAIKFIVFGVNISLDKDSEFYFNMFESATFAKLTGMLTLSLFVHNIIITLMKCNANQEKNTRDLLIAFFLVMSTYAFMGTLMFVSFPLRKSCIEDNILNNFFTGDIMTVIARFFLFFQLITVYPLICFMLRSQVLTIIFKDPYPNVIAVIVFNGIVVAAGVFFACFYPSIGNIIRFVGAISGFIHVYSLPCFLRMFSKKQDEELTICSIIIHSTIPLLGFVNVIAQFIV